MIIGTSKAILHGLISRVREDMRDPVLRNAWIGGLVGMAVSIPCGPLAMIVFPITGTVTGAVLTKRQ